MAALNLFPARVRFVNEDGTLTNEAYRALQIVFGRVGGSLGNVGTDTFTGQTTMGQSTENPSITDMINQPQAPDGLMVDVVQQPISQDASFLDVMQPVSNGINASITTALLVGKTITVQNGLITSFS